MKNSCKCRLRFYLLWIKKCIHLICDGIKERKEIQHSEFIFIQASIDVFKHKMYNDISCTNTFLFYSNGSQLMGMFTTKKAILEKC